MNFYGACKTWEKRPIECICRAGEVVFVPNGWWHLVINLEESIAITQNYVSRLDFTLQTISLFFYNNVICFRSLTLNNHPEEFLFSNLDG